MNKIIITILAVSLHVPVLLAQQNDTTVTRERKARWFWRPLWPASHVSMKGWEDMAIGGGYISGRQISYALGADIGPEVTSATPTVYASYRYFLFKRIALGFTVGTQTMWGNSDYDNTGQVYTFRDFSTTFALEMTAVYLKRDFIMLYWHLGAGLSYVDIKYYGALPYPSDEKNIFLNFQYTPFGMRLGKTYAGFIEFGLGYKGLVNAGFSYNFRHEKKQEKDRVPY